MYVTVSVIYAFVMLGTFLINEILIMANCARKLMKVAVILCQLLHVVTASDVPGTEVTRHSSVP